MAISNISSCLSPAVPSASPVDLVTEGGPVVVVLYLLAAVAIVCLQLLDMRHGFDTWFDDNDDDGDDNDNDG